MVRLARNTVFLALLANAASVMATDSLRPLASVLAPQQRGHNDWRAANVEVAPPLGNPLTDALTLSTAERRLFTDASDGRLDELSLLEAALVACGVDEPAAASRYQQRFAAASDELRAAIGTSSRHDAGTRDEGLRPVAAVHRVLHERLLHGGYDTNATDLAGTLDTGVYNCASATLLFVALCEPLGVAAQAVELPGHVRCLVEINAEQFEIEVTCPNWPQAQRRISSGVSLLDEPAVASTASGARRRVTSLGLLAMIYYNRGVDAFELRRYAEATAANRRALLLDPSNQTARGNLLAAVNNWALALCDAGRLADAETLLAAGQQFDPDHRPFAHNAGHVRRLSSQTQPNARVIRAGSETIDASDASTK
jgi:tetratricopeptide (TPR) repeat protein